MPDASSTAHLWSAPQKSASTHGAVVQSSPVPFLSRHLRTAPDIAQVWPAEHTAPGSAQSASLPLVTLSAQRVLSQITLLSLQSYLVMQAASFATSPWNT